MRTLLLLALLLPACASVPAGFVRVDHLGLPSTDVEGSPMWNVLPSNAIPAVDRPTFVSLDVARAQHEPGEPVMVLAVNDEVRVYSTWTLSAHEVVNDRVGDVPVAVTY